MIGMTEQRAAEILDVVERLGFTVRWRKRTTTMLELLCCPGPEWDLVGLRSALDFLRQRFGNPPYCYATDIDPIGDCMRFRPND